MEYKFLSNALITIGEIKQEIPSEPTMFAAIKALMRKGRLIKLKGGLYATINPITQDLFANKFEIATALYKDACVGYHSALEYYGLGNQVYTRVQVFTQKKYPISEINGLDYEFFINDNDDGISVVEHNALVRVTDIERTVIDCVNRLDVSGGIEEVLLAIAAISYCDEQKLLLYLSRLGKKFVYKKIGYLFSIVKPSYLSDNFYEICKAKMSKRVDDIRENKNANAYYSKEWKLVVPKNILNTEN